MKKNTLSLLLGITAALFWAAPAFSQPLLMTRDDFQSYTVNAELPIAAVPGVHGAYLTGGDALWVVTDPTDAANKVARITRTGGSGSYLYAGALGGTIQTFSQLAVAGAGLRLNYDVYVNSGNLNQFYGQLQYGNSGSAALMAVYFKAGVGGQHALEYMVAGKTATALGINILGNHWYSLTYDVYQVAGQWVASASITDKTTSISTVLFSDQALTLADTNVNSFLRVNFYQFGTAANTNFSYVDNLSLQVVPEPGSVVLTVAGVAALAWVRRRRARMG